MCANGGLRYGVANDGSQLVLVERRWVYIVGAVLMKIEDCVDFVQKQSLTDEYDGAPWAKPVTPSAACRYSASRLEF